MNSIGNVKVFYELWQMECCGDPFKIGDSVDWLVTTSEEIRMPVKVDDLKFIYEAHSDDWENIYVFKGVVKEISILYEKYELVKGDHHNMLIPVHGVGELVKAESSEIEEAYRGDLKASGYLVVLDNVSVRPAKQEEVTFG